MTENSFCNRNKSLNATQKAFKINQVIYIHQFYGLNTRVYVYAKKNNREPKNTNQPNLNIPWSFLCSSIMFVMLLYLAYNATSNNHSHISPSPIISGVLCSLYLYSCYFFFLIYLYSSTTIYNNNKNLYQITNNYTKIYHTTF